MVSNELKIMDENHYYPFGLKHQKYSSGSKLDLMAQSADIARPGYATSTPFMYKYNGKEYQDELGLNMYDMDMRQYDPAIARWVVLDPVIHHSMSPYNAFDNNPVFWADPSGANSIFDQQGVSASSVTVMGSGMTISAGGAGDNNTKLPQSNTSQNSSSSSNNSNDIVWEGGDPNAVELDEVVVVNGDFEGAMNRGLQQAVNYIRNFNRLSGYGGSNSSGLPSYIRNAYINNYDPRLSPYTPDAMSLNIGFSMNFLIVHVDVSASLIFSPGEISLGGSANGGFGYTGFKPSWGPYASVGFHDVYGSQTDVLKGMQGVSSSTNTALGPVNINYSQSATMDGRYDLEGGTRNVNIGVGNPGLGASQTFPATVIWRPFK